MTCFAEMDIALIAEADRQNGNNKLTRTPVTKISLSETAWRTILSTMPFKS